MDEKDIELLEENDWIVECESPFEIRHRDGGSFASGMAARILLYDLQHEKNNTFSEQDMHDSFNAGINRGVQITSILMNRDIGENYPTYSEYMKRFEE